MKKLHSFTIEESINAPKEKVWEVLYDRFGDIQVFNPNIDGSHFTKGETGEVGCERICELDSKSFVKERITQSSGQDSFTVDIYESNLPMMETMLAHFEVLDQGDNKTIVIVNFEYNTKPAFMAPIVKIPMTKTFKKLTVGLKYFLETGNEVSKTGFKEVFRKYKKLDLAQAFAA